VIDEFPNDGARGVSRFTDVAVLFSERVRGVNERTFVLFSARSGRSVHADVFRDGSREWVLEPRRSLSRNTRYVVELVGDRFGIRDFDGNRLRDTDWTFRTRR
jgi:Bacterial Ig-like domain